MKTLYPLVDNCLGPALGVILTVGFSKILYPNCNSGMKRVLLNSNTYFLKHTTNF